MKKKLLILAVAGFALAACSSDETVASQATSEANEISFRPFTTGVTRAADITSDNISSFRVTAFETGGTSTDYFRNVDYFKNDNNTFTSANKIYWPSGFNLDFYAYAPISTAVVGSDKQIVPTSDGTTYDANSYKKFKVTPALENIPTNNQVDLVYAKAKNWGKISEDTPEGHIILPTVAAGVTINFRHAESKVVVKLKNSNPNLYFTVKDVEIGYLASSGVFTYPVPPAEGADALETDAQINATLPYDYWTANTSHDGVYQIANTANTEFSTANPYGFEQILIPQTLTAATTYDKVGNDPAVNDPFHGAYIMVEYKVQNGDGNGAYIVGAANGNNEYVKAIWPLTGITWLPGYKYIYTVDLAGGGYYEKNHDNDADLDPILGGSEIMFATVTVDGWEDINVVRAGSNVNFFVAYTGGDYTFSVGGLTEDNAIAVSNSGDAIYRENHAPSIGDVNTVPASGIVTITAEVDYNNSQDTRTNTITLTETNGTTTTITFNQEAGQ